MMKSISTALLAILLCTAGIPAFGQKSTFERRNLNTARSATQFGAASAITDGEGVLVRWEMKTEIRNAGFDVYRTTFGVTERVNETVIIGSGAISGTRISYGGSYQFFDPKGDTFSQYTIESLAIDGRRLSSKPFGTTATKDLKEITGMSSETFRTAALSNNSNIEAATSALTTELSQIVESTKPDPDLETHRSVVSRPGAKIAVRRDGLYRVGTASLFAVGIPSDSSKANWRLFFEGNEQAIIVDPNGEYIEFFGKGIDRPESDTQYYYLIADTVAGKRIGTRVLRSIPGFAESTAYQVVAEKKERTSFSSQINNGDEENYWGRLVRTEPPETIAFNLNGIDFDSPTAEITLQMQGFSLNAHRITFGVNGNAIGNLSATHHDNYSTTVSIPTNYLLEGENILQLSPSSGSDFNFFDRVRVKYDRLYQADLDQTSFFTPGYTKIDITGFSSPNVRVFDTTYDGTPRLFANIPVVQDGSTYTVKLPSSRTMVAYAVNDTAILQSHSITANNPSTLSSADNEADLVIITHSTQEFMAAAEVWADYRRDQGFNTKIIDIADIFDEFNYGVFSSEALKSFFAFVDSEWELAPGYALLLGDGSYDSRNYEGFGFNDLIPTQDVRLIFEESGSDEALADFDGDGLAEIAIGRIPARTAATITTIFNKTVAFETEPLQSLSRGALLVHDLPIGYDFSGMSQVLGNELPREMPITLVDRATPTAQTDLINEMNTGKFIINYSGHGSAGVWASSSFFGINSVPQLTNGNSPSIYNMLTCLNGFFLRPDADALSETLLKNPNGGAVAAWSSTSETTPDIQLVMGTRFFNQMAAGQISRMGDLIKDAKTAIPAGADVRLSWVLLGDPMLKVR